MKSAELQPGSAPSLPAQRDDITQVRAPACLGCYPEAGTAGLQDFLGRPGLLLCSSPESCSGPGSLLWGPGAGTWIFRRPSLGLGSSTRDHPWGRRPGIPPHPARTGCSVVLRLHGGGLDPWFRPGDSQPQQLHRALPWVHTSPPHWVPVAPACGAYAWLVAWCLLFIRLFPLNFCSRQAHLAPWYLSFPRVPPAPLSSSTTSLPGPGSPLWATEGALDLGWRGSEGRRCPRSVRAALGKGG